MSNTTTVKAPDVKGLRVEDGEVLESAWHRIAMSLLITLTHELWRDRRDYYVGGNMFVYFSPDQEKTHDYKGPDFFVVTDVDGSRERQAWVLWEEGGRYPDLIIELLSPSTRDKDLGPKKRLYEKTFGTPEYFCYDPDTKEFLGWRLAEGKRYVSLEEDESGRMWSQVLQAYIGRWSGAIEGMQAEWLRFWTDDDDLVPRPQERAEQQAARAEAEAARAEDEAERAEIAESLEQVLAAMIEGGVEQARLVLDETPAASKTAVEARLRQRHTAIAKRLFGE